MAIKLALLSTFTLTLASFLNIAPSPRDAEIRKKSALCESLAITSALLAQHQQDQIVAENFTATVKRSPEVASACIRSRSGEILHQVGDHHKHWQLAPNAPSTRDNIRVPVKRGEQVWANVELSFHKDRSVFSTLADHPLIALGVASIVLNALFFRWYLKRAFQYLDPSRSVPTHVRETLNTFAEGVAVMDSERRIVLANDKFKRYVGRDDQSLLGQSIDSIPWESDSDQLAAINWRPEDTPSEGMRITLTVDQHRRTFLVNTSEILTDDGQCRGLIASFDEITQLEKKREELSKMLIELKSSKEKLSERNRELQFLATRDPLTGCINRRTFFESFDEHWNNAKQQDLGLSCLMVDLDHFKSINDNHGHSVGDDVLRQAALAIQNTARPDDIVCRYGGEEFCVLLPQTNPDEAVVVAEAIRRAIEQLEFDMLSVTSSLGVSSIEFGADDPQALLDEADKCLYAAKRGGRNCVIRWDEVTEDFDVEQASDRSSENQLEPVGDRSSIPYPAVTSLISALAYRDPNTAAHSTRVAELCVATASGLLSVKQTYELEVAALLHDIGKIGVPDAILLKPGKLTEEEWATMEHHDRIGVEIVEASFSNQQLVDTMRYRHAAFESTGNAPHFPAGKEIPIGARIIAIADAYDAIVTDRLYRPGRSQQEAFAELRRCAGSQFDPELVERFIAVIGDHRPISLASASKQTALLVGQQIERLAQAIDDGDGTGIRALSARLESTAAQGGIPEIESVAAEIRMAADNDQDLQCLLDLVSELMSLCRAVQKVYTDVAPARNELN